MNVLGLQLSSDSIETLKSVATGTSIGMVVIALLALKFIKSMVVRALLMIVAVALSLGIYSQRAQLSDCLDKIQAGTQKTETCTFFGRTITIPNVSK